MSKIIVMAIVVLVFFWLLRRALTRRKPRGGAGSAKEPASAAPELVACAHCGVHLPKNEAFATPEAGMPAAGRYFCTEEHLKLGAR